MKRRSKAGGKTAKAAMLRRRNPPKRASGRTRSGGDRNAGTATPPADETLEQLSATSEVLKIIGGSQGRLETVFQALLERAARLCEANFGILWLHEDGGLRIGAMHNAPRAFAESIAQRRKHEPILRPGPLTPLARVIATKRVVHVADYAASEAYKQRYDSAVRMVELARARTLLNVPMLRGKELIGDLSIYRQEVRPFTDKQIALVEHFAAQAVIAIENARLLNELRESLGQQTATADVLKVISSSPGDLEPVFQAMLENATRICGAKFGTLYRFENEKFQAAALFGSTPRLIEAQKQRGPFIPTAGTLLNRLMRMKEVAHTADYAAESAQSLPARLGGARSTVAVPMLKEGALVGAFAIYRQEVRPFTEKQIELLRNFAAQAVIAIENTRLLNELRESLEQQTATSEVLSVISTSPGELEPVFQAILESATRICTAKFGTLYRFDGEAFHLAAQFGMPPALAEFQRQRGRFQPSLGGHLDRVMRTKQVSQTADIAAEPVLEPPARFGVRTFVGVPMLKDDVLMGVINFYREEVRPFTEKQIELVTNFAAQAVIAIENTRLLNELRQRTDDLSESLEQQTATSKVLEVISRSAFDLQAVFETVAENSVRLCGADRAFIYRFDGQLLQMVAAFNAPQKLKDFISQNPIRPGRYSTSARAALERRTVHIPDVLADPEHSYGTKNIDNLRTVLAVPILKGDDLLGVLTIFHLDRVKPFTDKQIGLVETFADQAAIAIENVRLFQGPGETRQ
jgi:GAF domain-containing protein